MRSAGADLIQIYTSLVYRGPTLVRSSSVRCSDPPGAQAPVIKWDAVNFRGSARISQIAARERSMSRASGGSAS